MKHSLKDILYYLQGNIRYQLFYSKFAFLIREHIRLQIIARINSMNFECYETGSCIRCGCNTTHLQMCNKPCDGFCYPRMLNKEEWKDIQTRYYRDNSLQQVWVLDKDNLKFIRAL